MINCRLIIEAEGGSYYCEWGEGLSNMFGNDMDIGLNFIDERKKSGIKMKSAVLNYVMEDGYVLDSFELPKNLLQ